jgi:hypothetical protein
LHRRLQADDLLGLGVRRRVEGDDRLDVGRPDSVEQRPPASGAESEDTHAAGPHSLVALEVVGPRTDVAQVVVVGPAGEGLVHLLRRRALRHRVEDVRGQAHVTGDGQRRTRVRDVLLGDQVPRDDQDGGVHSLGFGTGQVAVDLLVPALERDLAVVNGGVIKDSRRGWL